MTFCIFFLDYIYFSISLQFHLNIQSNNRFVNVHVMQLRIVLDWEPVDSAWSSLDVDGAMTPATQEEGTALKGLLGAQWSSLARTARRWFWTPVFVLKRSTMSGPLSSVQVIKMWWTQFQFFKQHSFSVKLFFKQTSKPGMIFSFF